MPYCPPPTPPIGCGPKAWEGYRAECKRQQRVGIQCIWAYIVCCLAMFAFFGWMLYAYNPNHTEAAVYTPTGNGFIVEGSLRGSYEHGIQIDRTDLYQLLADKLHGGEAEFALERVRVTVEVIDK